MPLNSSREELIYCAGDEPRVEFKVRTMREYIDLKPYRDLPYSVMFERLSKLHIEKGLPKQILDQANESKVKQ